MTRSALTHSASTGDLSAESQAPVQTSAPDHGYASTGLRVPLISLSKTLQGAVTQARLQRTWRLWLASFVLGLACIVLGQTSVQALGLSLLIPGAGFLLHATGSAADIALYAGLFVGTVFAVLLSAFIWVATGNILLLLAVWLGSTVWTTQVSHDTWSGATLLVPVLVLAFALWRRRAGQANAKRLRSERDQINVYLKPAMTVVTQRHAVSGLPLVEEMKAESLPLMRFLLDRALQPVDEFNGFDRIDEFREAAKRYQICINSYSLSNQFYSHMPAFRGYLHEAQQRMSLKMQDHRVWSYWALENFWGNLKLDANPMPHDNIMYTGWYGSLLAMNMSNFSDQTFNQPGSIRLAHPSGRVYSYNFSQMCEIMAQNFRKSDFCLFPCEPRWIYPMCNNFGGLALKTHDRLFGTDYWSGIEDQYRQKLEDEFITVNGRITAIRDYRTGMTIPGLTSAMADAAAAYYMNPLFPDLARRSWEVIRHELVDIRGGVLNLKTNGWDNIDFGNYKLSKISTYALIACAAREMGDIEAADLLLARLDDEYPSEIINGVQHYAGASTGAHSVIHGARNMRPNAIHDMINVGMPRPWAEGPLLDKVSYPDVLVSKAVSDGRALDIVLHHGLEGGRQSIGLAQLRAGGRYRVTGALNTEFVADARGESSLLVDVHGRTPLFVSPLD